MKRVLLFLSLFIGCNFISAQVDLEIVDLKVNNLSSTSINFNSQNIVNIKFQVNLKTFDGDFNNVLGNLLVHTKNSANSTSVVRDVKPITFTVTYPPFVTQTTYNGVTYIDLNLSTSEFYQNGGVLFVEYKNNNAQSFLSSNLNITGGSIPDNVNLPPGSNTICCNQVIRYGDKPQDIVGSNIDSNRVLTWLQYDANSNYIGSVGQNTINVDRNLLRLDYLFETMEFKRFINPTQTQNGGWSNKVRIEVIPNPILSNNISSQAARINDNEYEVNYGDLINCSGIQPFAYPALINDPFHIPNRRTEPSERVTDYQWQYSRDSRNWVDILGEVEGGLASFLPENYTNNKFKIRRIAKYQGISLVSNVLSFTVRDSNPLSNYICCNQTLVYISRQIPSTPNLTGSLITFNYLDANINSNNEQLQNYNISFQWQYNNGTTWLNLNCVSNDCQPNIIPDPYNFRNIKYRRIATVNYSTISNLNVIRNGSYTLYSDPILIDAISTRSRIFMENDIDDDSNSSNENYKIFPNPASLNLNVILKSSNNINKNHTIKLYNNIGILLKEINAINKNNDKINIDISDLPKGIYTLIIQNGENINQEKVIIE